MLRIIRRLIWKEFQEQKWACLAVTAVALAIPLTYVFRDVSLALGGVQMDLAMYPIAAGLFFGTRAAAGERTNRSASFVAALPVSHRLLGMMRLSGAIIASMAPLFVLLAFACFLNPRTDEIVRITWIQLFAVFGMSALATMLCLAIAAAAGSGQASEIRAGLVGFAAILLTWFAGY